MFPGNRTHNLCAANTMLYHWATGALWLSHHPKHDAVDLLSLPVFRSLRGELAVKRRGGRKGLSRVCSVRMEMKWSLECWLTASLSLSLGSCGRGVRACGSLPAFTGRTQVQKYFGVQWILKAHRHTRDQNRSTNNRPTRAGRLKVIQ